MISTGFAIKDTVDKIIMPAKSDKVATRLSMKMTEEEYQRLQRFFDFVIAKTKQDLTLDDMIRQMILQPQMMWCFAEFFNAGGMAAHEHISQNQPNDFGWF